MPIIPPISEAFQSTVTSGSLVMDSRYQLVETATTYDATGRITGLADARGNVTSYEYGGNANNAFLTKVTRAHDATGSVDLVTDLTYDANGYLQSIEDEGGTLRHFTYDGFGRLRQIKAHDGSTVLKAYGYTYSRTSANGWAFQAASPNAVVDSTFLQPSQAVVSTGYLDGLGRPIQTVQPDSSSYIVAATEYDAAGRAWRSWKPYTRTTAGYDPAFETNASDFYKAYHSVGTANPFVETQYTPDQLERASKVIPEFTGSTASAFTTQTYGVDAASSQTFTEVTDESGKKTRAYTDLFGNQVRTILGFGATEATTTILAYNVLGQRTQATDPRGLVTTYTLDTRGLLTERTSPDAGTIRHKYDAAGNLRFTQDANQAAAGQVYFTTYDFAYRPLVSGLGSATFSGLDPNTTASFENTEGNWLVIRAYDAKPSAGANDYPWSLFSAEIGNSAVANLTGRLAAVASRSNGAWQATLFSYDADGRVATRYTYTHQNGGTTVLAALNTTVAYTRNLQDAVTERALTVGTNTFNHWYEYDARGLLSKVFASDLSTRPATADVTYTYRPSGELESRRFAGESSPVPLRYTIREQLEGIGDPASTTYPFSAQYTYHANGTISSAQFYSAGSPAADKRYGYVFGTTSYDALNRLRSADFSSWNGAGKESDARGRLGVWAESRSRIWSGQLFLSRCSSTH